MAENKVEGEMRRVAMMIPRLVATLQQLHEMDPASVLALVDVAEAAD